jgi:hypothetical protein
MSIEATIFRELSSVFSEGTYSWVLKDPTTLKITKFMGIVLGSGLLVAGSFAVPILGMGIAGCIGAAGAAILSFFWALHNKELQSPFPQVVRSGPEAMLSRRLRDLSNESCSGKVIGVYITSNEAGIEEARRVLKDTPKVQGGCHIGFSGWHNLDIMAERRSDHGLICDFNSDNKRFIEKTLTVLKGAETREGFAREMVRTVQKIEQVFSKNLRDRGLMAPPPFSPPLDGVLFDTKDEIRNELQREGSWLAKEESFQYIKSLAKRDLIAVITGDIRDTERFQKITKIYHDNAIPVDSLYLSNICDYMKEADKEKYIATVSSLTGFETLVVSAAGAQQKVFLGRDLKGSQGMQQLFEGL